MKHRLGLTVLLITHDIQMVTRVADDLVILEQGKVVEHGPTSQIVVSPSAEYTRRLLNTRLPLLGAHS
jgi:ABC-type glutathione transport system ATPase component